VLKAVQADANLAALITAPSDAADPDRDAARHALMDYLTDRMTWDEGRASLFVEYASMDLGQAPGQPLDAGFRMYWGNTGEMGQLAYANMGRLAAIGEQKTTQLFAELASRFDPTVKPTY
jgi:hypothetical protein